MPEKEPREHGLIFGRGDDLPEGTEEPPVKATIGVAMYGPIAPIAFGDPPPESVEIVGEVPWELRDDTDSGDAAPTRD